MESLDSFVEPIDIMQALRGNCDDEYGVAVALLDRRPPEKRHVTIEEMQKYYKTIETIVSEEYPRGITITLTDNILDKYTENFIIKALKMVIKKHTKKFIIVPDYSKDGRLHFHGIITLHHIKFVRRLKKDLNNFGWNTIDNDPKPCIGQYMFKLYDIHKNNKFSKIESIKHLNKLPEKHLIQNIEI